MKSIFLFGLLAAVVSAACPTECAPCLNCVMTNTTDGACVDCAACYGADGCSLDTVDYTAADGFGQYLKGAACEKFALDFYGPLHCMTEAVTQHVASCYTPPLTKQFQTCVETDSIAEVVDCVAAATTTQVTVCLSSFVQATMNASAATGITTAYDSCQDAALEAQESTCNDAALGVQTGICKAAATLADKKAGILEYAAIFSGIVQDSQAFSCANNGATYSPTVKTKVPTVTTKTPTVKTKTPTVKTASPVSTKIPTVKTTAPSVKTKTPTVKTKTPTVKTGAPTGIPTVTTNTPVTLAPSVTTSAPSHSPTMTTTIPTVTTKAPTTTPTVTTIAPTACPVSKAPTAAPTGTPVTVAPTGTPVTVAPTGTPVTAAPSVTGTTKTPVSKAPTASPVTATPVSKAPTAAPTACPVSKAPTGVPTGTPVTVAPTGTPVTASPITTAPTSAPTISSDSPTVETTTPTVKTTSPVSKAPTTSPSSAAPTVATKNPVTVTPTSASPTVKTKTPTVKTTSPTVTTKTPTVKTKTPTIKTTSPTIKTKTPTVRTNTPTIKTKTPTVKTKTPTVRTSAPVTKTPTVTTSAPTSAPTSVCVGASLACEAAFTNLFDWESSLLSTSQVFTVLNASQCTNTSINLLEPFYKAVFGCYKNPSTCGAGTTNAGSYAVVTKSILTKADSCTLDATLAGCSKWGQLYQGACATIDTACQTCLDARTYNSTNKCSCSDATLASAATCKSSKLSCDGSIASTNSACTNVTVIAEAACKTIKTNCTIDMEQVIMKSNFSSVRCDAAALVNIYSDFAVTTGACVMNPAMCPTIAQAASVTACYEEGPSCGVALGDVLLKKSANTDNCTDASITAGATCLAEVTSCVSGNTAKCRLASTLPTVSACSLVTGTCAAFKNVADGGCTNATIAALTACDASGLLCSAQVFNESAPYSIATGNATTMTACNAMGKRALSKNSQCFQRVRACADMIAADFTIFEYNGICESMGRSSLTGQPILEDTDYATWDIWTTAICVDDTGRTPAPTAAPVVIAKVSRAVVFTTGEQTTICAAMNRASMRAGVTVSPTAIKCVMTTADVTARRRLLNVTTTTFYTVEGSISATMAAVSKAVLAEVGLDTFAKAISDDIKTADPTLGDSAEVTITPLSTDAPTRQPTATAPTSPPTDAAAPTNVEGFSSSNRVVPTLIAAASILLVLF